MFTSHHQGDTRVESSDLLNQEDASKLIEHTSVDRMHDYPKNVFKP